MWLEKVCHSFPGRLCQLAPLRWQHRQTNRRTTGKLTLDRRPSWYRSCFQSCLIWANLHFFRCRLFSHHRTASPTFSFIGDNTFKQFFFNWWNSFFSRRGDTMVGVEKTVKWSLVEKQLCRNSNPGLNLVNFHQIFFALS